MASDVHVVPRDDKWALTGTGGITDPIYDTQEEAIKVGRDVAKSNGSELVIHGADGTIRQKDSHGNDPRSVKG
jgi:hypothetical protein